MEVKNYKQRLPGTGCDNRILSEFVPLVDHYNY